MQTENIPLSTSTTMPPKQKKAEATVPNESEAEPPKKKRGHPPKTVTLAKTISSVAQEGQPDEDEDDEIK